MSCREDEDMREFRPEDGNLVDVERGEVHKGKQWTVLRLRHIVIITNGRSIMPLGPWEVWCFMMIAMEEMWWWCWWWWCWWLMIDSSPQSLFDPLVRSISFVVLILIVVFVPCCSLLPINGFYVQAVAIRPCEWWENYWWSSSSTNIFPPHTRMQDRSYQSKIASIFCQSSSSPL